MNLHVVSTLDRLSGSVNVTMNLPFPLTFPGVFENCSIADIKASIVFQSVVLSCFLLRMYL